jgi:hypothetical protein
MILIYLSFPETSHPGSLGIEKVVRRRRFHIAWVNPLSSLWLVRSPNVFATVGAFDILCTGFKLIDYAVDGCFESCARQ